MCYRSILLPFDGSPEAARAIPCALWLVRACGATLHVIHAADPAHAALAAPALARAFDDAVPATLEDDLRARVVLHHSTRARAEAVMEAIDAYTAGLVIMTVRAGPPGEDPSEPWGGSRLVRDLLERARVPVLLLPTRYRERLPWRAVTAAVSGEPGSDGALQQAVRLASALAVPLSVVIVQDGAPAAQAAAFGAYADSPQHEYPARLGGLLERGGVGDASGVSLVEPPSVTLCQGEPATSVLEQAAISDAGVVVLGCHRAFGPGRAPVIRRLVERADRALLIVPVVQGSGAHLVLAPG